MKLLTFNDNLQQLFYQIVVMVISYYAIQKYNYIIITYK